MSKRLIIIPRWAGSSTSDWYPWLSRELKSDHQALSFAPIIAADMPNPGAPTIPAWVQRVKELIGPDPTVAAQTVIIGHSVGCQAVVRALAELPDGMKVGGVFCVAGWFWTDAPWASLRPWIDTPFDAARAKAAATQPIVLLISDNDPHTSDWRANQKAWEDQLAASVVLAPGAGHFNGGKYPIILDTLRRLSNVN